MIYRCTLLLLFMTSTFFSQAQDVDFLKQIQDPALVNCIEKQIQKKSWQSPEQVIKLKCHNKGIKSLKGLEVFTHLEKLSLFKNKLVSADLSQLKLLTELNLSANRLSSLSLTGLENLKTLYLFKNKLKTIDLTGLTKLEKVRISNNKLEVLDISSLKSLKKAYFYDNKLEDLILTKLPKLKLIDLKQNPMSDEVYDRYDAMAGITVIHDGNADDWK